MKRLMVAALIATTTLGIGPAKASSVDAGYVSFILSVPGGAVLFNHSGVRTGLPSCMPAYLGARWAFNASTPAGQSKLSVLLMAYASKKKIIVLGSGGCGDHPDTETADLIIIDDS